MLKQVTAWLVFACLLASCEPVNRWLGKKDDWIGEEVVEKAIQLETGINLDLSPSTPE